MKAALLLLIVVTTIIGCPIPAPAGDNDARLARVRQILAGTPLIDGHNDAAWRIRRRFDNHLDRVDFAKGTPPLQTDIGRLRAGCVGGQFWSVFVPVEFTGAVAVQATLEQIDTVNRLASRYDKDLEIARKASDVVRIHRKGRIASLIGVEGGHCINESLAVLRQLSRAGARYMTLTHWKNTAWADSATDAPVHGGLTAFGRAVVREMNREGMLVDLSHVSDETMLDAIEASSAPVVFTHSSARAVCAHPRNVPDHVLERVGKSGGLVMVNFAGMFVSEECRRYDADLEAETVRAENLHIGDPKAAAAALIDWKTAHPAPRATLSQVADHIDHIRKVAGIDAVGLGGDYDGIEQGPVGLEDVSGYPHLLAELVRRGYSDDDIRKVAGLNALRVLTRAEEVARDLQRKTAPSDATLQQLDAR